MAAREKLDARPASRFRLRLAASALIAAPALAATLAGGVAEADGTLVIDSRGAYSVEERAAFGGGLIDDKPGDAVTLNFSVLDRLADARPSPGHIQLRRPSSQLAETAPREKPIRLKPPPLVPRRPGDLDDGGERLQFALKPPAPPRRPAIGLAARPASEGVAATGAFASLPPLPPRRPNDGQLAAAPATPRPTPPSASAPKTDLPPPPAPAAIAPVLLAPTPAPDAPEPSSARKTARAFLPTEAPDAAATQLASTPPAHPAPPRRQKQHDDAPALQARLRDVDPVAGLTDEMRRQLDAEVALRQAPPDMAQPGWRNPAPAAIDAAAAAAANLPDLASLAPPAPDNLPPPEDGAAIAPPEILARDFPQPGDAVLAPPPPPSRVAEILGRPETAGALPEPETTFPQTTPRRALTVPPSLAQVLAPREGPAGPPRQLLSEDGGDARAAAAPDFASLPLPEPQPPAGDDTPTAPAPAIALAARQPAPPRAPAPPPMSAPEQLSLAIDSARASDVVRDADADADPAMEIAFAAASRTLPATAEPALSRVVARLKNEPGMTVSLAGGAVAEAPKAARELAIARAVAVHRYLVSRGVGHAAIKVEPVTSASRKDAVSVRLLGPA